MKPLPISALLSKALVAFTIEFDNEFESRFPHSTARDPAARSNEGPWLVSMPMWSNLLRWLDPDEPPAVPVSELADLVNLPGLRRWGYVKVDPDGRIGPTRAGRRAQALWALLPDEIESRWCTRFGDAEVEGLRRSLTALVDQLDPQLPWHLPVSTARREQRGALVGPRPSATVPLDLAALLARPLITFRRDFEDESRLSLPLCANVLRVLGARGTRVRDVAALAGISREAVSISLGLLVRLELAAEGHDGRTKTVSLTDRGRRAQAKSRRALEQVEAQWSARFSPSALAAARTALERVLTSSQFGDALEPHPDGWRAHPPYAALTAVMLADPLVALPEYPMVSHRGGYPDGS